MPGRDSSGVFLLVVFNVPSTARSFRDGTPIYCPLRRTWSSINTPFRPGIEPRVVAWQSITLPLRHASSTGFIRALSNVNVIFWYGQTFWDLSLMPYRSAAWTCKCRLWRHIFVGDPPDMHLRSPRLLCVRSLGSPWYDYVYFNSASSSIQWVVSLLKWLTELSVLNVSHDATTNNNVSKTDLWLGA